MRDSLLYSGFPDFVRLLARRFGPGMCDRCGKKSEFYSLCDDCAQMAKVGSWLRDGRKSGELRSERRGRGLVWYAAGDKPVRKRHWRAQRKLDQQAYERLVRRGRPRLGGKAIDPEDLIRAAITELAKPSTEEEIATQIALMRWRTPGASARPAMEE